MKGFTLIELIIVIVIIGILAAIAVPKYLDLADAANAANIQANTKSVQAAVNLYYANSLTDPAIADGFPAAIAADMFTDNQIPATASGTYTWEYTAATGVVTNNVP